MSGTTLAPSPAGKDPLGFGERRYSVVRELEAPGTNRGGRMGRPPRVRYVSGRGLRLRLPVPGQGRAVRPLVRQPDLAVRRREAGGRVRRGAAVVPPAATPGGIPA